MRVTFIVLSVFWLAQVYSQDKKVPIFNKGNFTIYVFVREGSTKDNCKTPWMYLISMSGACPSNMILTWDIPYYDCNNKKLSFPVRLSIKKGQTSISENRSIRAVKLQSYIEGEVSSAVVDLPDNFRIEGPEQVLEGESTNLKVRSDKNPPGLVWKWRQQGSNEIIGEGSAIDIRPVTSTLYSVFAIVNGFQTSSKSFSVKVKLKPAPPKEFTIAHPNEIMEEDIAELKIEARNMEPGIEWKWYREGESEPFEKGHVIFPVLKVTTKFFVQGELNGKKSPMNSFIVIVRKTPEPPTNFTVKGPVSVEEGKEVNLSIEVNDAHAETRWLWYRQNENKSFHEGRTLKIKAEPGMKFKVRSALFKKVSAPNEYMLNVTFPSIIPEVVGPVSVCNPKSKIRYTINGGRLGSKSSKWLWYSGTCGSGELIGSGGSIDIEAPPSTTQFYVIPENDPTLCKSFSIAVYKPAQLPISINRPEYVCYGDPFVLSVQNVELNGNSKWVWYQSSLTGSGKTRIGEGLSISTRALVSTLYSIRAEGGNCDSSPEITTKVEIIPPGVNSGYVSTVQTGKNVTLTAKNAPSGNYRIVWYEGTCGEKKVATGEYMTFKPKKKPTSLFWRGEGICDTISCASIVLKKTTPVRPNYFFVNIGATSALTSEMPDPMVTIGSQSFYVRAKLDLTIFTDQFVDEGYPTDPSYNYTNGEIQNFNTTTGYYSYNGDEEIRRMSFTLGFLFGKKSFKYYGGVGYGKRELLGGFNFYRRPSNVFYGKSWVKNLDDLVEGIETELGIMIKLGGFNLMAGASMIYSPSKQQYYYDYHAGIGFSIKTK